jgi:hypothetical protein
MLASGIGPSSQAGGSPYPTTAPWVQTREQMAIIIAGSESRQRGGIRVELQEVLM